MHQETYHTHFWDTPRRLSTGFLLSLLLWASCAVPAPPETARVVQVVDGDTIHVRLGGQIHTVRLLGVDTPETQHPTRARGALRARSRPFHPASGLKARSSAWSKIPIADSRDRYGLLLRYVSLDGEHFNATLIRQGYAYAYRRFPFSRRQEFIRLEAKARHQGKGLWKRKH